MANVIRNTILSCQYKTSSANKLVDRKVNLFLLLRNKKYAKKRYPRICPVGRNHENWMQRKLILLQYIIADTQSNLNYISTLAPLFSIGCLLVAVWEIYKLSFRSNVMGQHELIQCLSGRFKIAYACVVCWIL